MKKFILIHNDEGDLSISGVFDTLSEAQIAMRKDFESYFLDVLKWSEEDFYEVLEIQGQDEYSGSCYIDETTAWSRYKGSLDWQIQEIEI